MRCCSARAGGPHERLHPPAGGGSGRPRGRAGGGAAAASSAAVGALQAALAAEHAAVYGYGVAGAHLSGARQKAAAQDWRIHEASRDALAAMITALGAQPVAAAAAYRLPFRVSSGRDAVSLAAFLEDRVATAYLGVVALTETRLRLFGARAVESAALRAAGWRGRTLAFPGLEAPAPSQRALRCAQPGAIHPGPVFPRPGITVPAADRARGRLIPPAACPPAAPRPGRTRGPAAPARRSASGGPRERLLDGGRRGFQVALRADPLGPRPPEPPVAVPAARGVDVPGRAVGRGMGHLQPRHAAGRGDQGRAHAPLLEGPGEPFEPLDGGGAKRERAVALQPRYGCH